MLMVLLAFRSEITKRYGLNEYLFEKIKSRQQNIRNYTLIDNIPHFLYRNKQNKLKEYLEEQIKLINNTQLLTRNVNYIGLILKQYVRYDLKIDLTVINDILNTKFNQVRFDFINYTRIV